MKVVMSHGHKSLGTVCWTAKLSKIHERLLDFKYRSTILWALKPDSCDVHSMPAHPQSQRSHTDMKPASSSLTYGLPSWL